MRSLFRLCNALAALIEEFAASGGVQILVDSWRSHAEESRSKARLADEKKLAAALARGDSDYVESVAHGLLVEASRSNGGGGKEGSVNRSGFWDSDSDNESLVGDNADPAGLQREVMSLIG